jgi:aspartyl-tRNA synthetase
MVTDEINPNEVQSKKAAKKLAAKADKAAKVRKKRNHQQNLGFQKEFYNFQKAEHKSKEVPESESVDDGEDYSKSKYGLSKLIQSAETLSERNFVDVKELTKATSSTVWVRGRIHTSRCKGKQCFIVLRQQSSTVQVLIYVNENISKQMVKFSGS